MDVLKKVLSSLKSFFNNLIKNLKKFLSEDRRRKVKEFLVDKILVIKEFIIKVYMRLKEDDLKELKEQNKDKGSNGKFDFSLTIIRQVQIGFILLLIMLLFVGVRVYNNSNKVVEEIESITVEMNKLENEYIPVVRTSSDIIREVNQKQSSLFRWKAGFANLGAAESNLTSQSIEEIKELIDDPELLKTLDKLSKWNNKFQNKVIELKTIEKNSFDEKMILNEINDSITFNLNMSLAALNKDVWNHLNTNMDNLNQKITTIAEESQSNRDAIIIMTIVTLIIGSGLIIFVRMGIRQITAETKKRTYQAANKSEVVLSSAESMTKSADLVNEKINHSYDILEDLLNINREVFTSIEEVSVSIKEITTGVEGLAIQAEDISTSGSDTYQAIKNTYQRINSGNKLVNNTVDIMKELQQSVGKINQISDKIMKIGDQTNLLALNAAIEAARAGEAGRGFAVVAEEIKSLADESMLATKEVKDIVSNVQGVAKKAVEVMISDDSKQEDSIVSIFKEISTLTEGVTNKMEAVIAAAEDQAAATEEMSALTEEISAATEEISAQTEDNLLDTNNLTQIMKEVIEVNDELNEKVKDQSDQSQEQLELIKQVVEANDKLAK
ncbi:methyl-accepting chemotaxis protein [Orenia marismortui]|uniref:Methyl-accepting chemotaxis protein n=1 Tax=Orenia marismortui TaxID=46469 RepID=A0A4R8HGH4_9FIRM|nr:methyl-accepting chemotaxis protein [Orenia marismortui]TDX59305.1 methyl-accepting chemotaxis protein [Orenia marismortui]